MQPFSCQHRGHYISKSNDEITVVVLWGRFIFPLKRWYLEFVISFYKIPYIFEILEWGLTNSFCDVIKKSSDGWHPFQKIKDSIALRSSKGNYRTSISYHSYARRNQLMLEVYIQQLLGLNLWRCHSQEVPVESGKVWEHALSLVNVRKWGTPAGLLQVSHF